MPEVTLSFIKHVDRRELLIAVWSAEFTRALAGKAELATSPVVLRRLAERAANSADRTIEALRLLVEVEFRLASAGELDDCYMTWEKFVAYCHDGTLTDDHGHGTLATDDDHVSNVRVHPGDALHDSYVRPDWATHVCWYRNK